MLAALQLGDFFDANGEFGLVILGVVGFTDFGLLVFAIAYRVARRADVLPAVALILAVARIAPAALPGFDPEDRRPFDTTRTRWAPRTPPSRWS